MNDEELRVVNKQRDVSKDLSSPFVKFILEVADSEAADALEELATVKATDITAIQALQNKVWRAKCIETWLKELANAADSIVLTDFEE